MSLFRPADSSANSCSESNIYFHKSSNDAPSLSSQLFHSGKWIFHYEPEYDEEYFSVFEEDPPQEIELLHPSNSAISGSLSRPQVSFTPLNLRNSYRSSISIENPYMSCFDAIRHPDSLFSEISKEASTRVSDGQSREDEMDCDQYEIRSKLEELERELLDDTDAELFGPAERIDIHEEWVEPMKSLLLSNSTKEYPNNSNLSSLDSNKETLTPKQLLFDCATAISEGNMDEASAMITDLRQMVSIQGDPPQRLAAYMVEGLAAKMASSGSGLYKALRCKEPPAADRLSAMQILFEVCPCFKFGFMAANGAIAEACKDEEKVHIIDFDINQGSQYITLMQTLSSMPCKPWLRITGVDDPESVQRAVGGLKVIGQRLEKLAEAHGMPFEFRAIPVKTGDVTPSMLGCRSNEALVVNFAFQLHHMPDESVSTVNQRDQLLRMVKGLNPKLVTVVEQDVNTNTAPFFPRFVEVYNYYSAVFESLDITLPRESTDRMNVERQCLARDIVNIVACEGADRIERYEAAGKWRARMTMAGFVSSPLSSYVNGTIRGQLESYCDGYKLKEEAGALSFGWQDKTLIVAFAWK